MIMQPASITSPIAPLSSQLLPWTPSSPAPPFPAKRKRPTPVYRAGGASVHSTVCAWGLAPPARDASDLAVALQPVLHRPDGQDSRKSDQRGNNRIYLRFPPLSRTRPCLIGVGRCTCPFLVSRCRLLSPLRDNGFEQLTCDSLVLFGIFAANCRPVRHFRVQIVPREL